MYELEEETLHTRLYPEAGRILPRKRSANFGVLGPWAKNHDENQHTP